MNKSDYISTLSKYAYDNGISIYDYYVDLAKRIRLAENSNFEKWEIKCPFLTGEDYTKLLFSKDEKIVEYFASAMERVYRYNEPTALVPVNENTKLVVVEDKKEVNDEEVIYNGRVHIDDIYLRGLTDEETRAKYEEEAIKDAISNGVDYNPETMHINLIGAEVDEAASDIQYQAYSVIENKTKNINTNIEDKKDVKNELITLDKYEIVETKKDDLLTREEIKEVIDEKMDKLEDNLTNSDLSNIVNEKFTEVDEDNKLLSRDDIKEVIEEKINELENDLTNNDISSIVNEKFAEVDNDEDIVEIDNEYLSRDDIKDVINESYSILGSIGVFFTSVSKKLAKLLNGFAVVKEEEEDKVDLYYHDAEKGELRAKTTYNKEDLDVESGYYVNYQEYVSDMLDSLYDQYPTTTKIDFINEEGVECSLTELLEAVFEVLRDAGSIRFGKDLKGKEINSFQDLQAINTASQESYNGEMMNTGIYVRRDVLNKVFSKYKAKLTLADVNEDEISRHNSK